MTLRRDFLAFTAGAVVAKTVIPIAAKAEPAWPVSLFPPGHHPRLDPHPDAALLTACDAYQAVADAMDTFPVGHPEAEWNKAAWESSDALAAVIDLPATTSAGLRAKSRVLLREIGGMSASDAGDQERLLSWQLAQDVLAMTRAA